ncbi:hypothetical protein BHF71_04805 [Vulcanibacillus modesticaldus]|uniref:Stage III sporulation protein AH n=1 Tax=Vulcanibacillus modesticaldus TaxID=337097 RepID=A0A1D2YRS6_9BACI|nr:SpoIIIAH-like family protein [Vulcanibacillus modesticaldus]OEF95514.1 hypothetical protein BHF71_04805 [Vulcanibacillus modesticaldus]
MKKAVENSKQTVWVLTMLTVMVVLSAYYLVSEPLIPTEVVDNNLENTDPAITEMIIDESTGDLGVVDDVEAIEIDSSDLLIGLKMERDRSRSKQFDNLYALLNNSLSEEAITGIQDKIEYLQTVEESEFVLEKLIMADGYKDVVVFSNDTSVDVIIQTDSLSKTEAVKIIKMVSDRLKVPAVNVHIKTVK